MNGTIAIEEGLSVRASELRFTASRSGGPGGQHANKVSSRMTLYFDVAASPSLSEAQKRRVAERLATRINSDGVLLMHCQDSRSQAANRAILIERFAEMLRHALKRRRPRRRTKVPAAARRRRLEQKRRRGEVKRLRGSAERS